MHTHETTRDRLPPSCPLRRAPQAIEREALRSLREIREKKLAKRAQEDAVWKTTADAIRADAAAKAAAPRAEPNKGGGLGAPEAPSYVVRRLSLAPASPGGGSADGGVHLSNGSAKEEAKAISHELALGKMLTFRFIEVRGISTSRPSRVSRRELCGEHSRVVSCVCGGLAIEYATHTPLVCDSCVWRARQSVPRYATHTHTTRVCGGLATEYATHTPLAVHVRSRFGEHRGAASARSVRRLPHRGADVECCCGHKKREKDRRSTAARVVDQHASHHTVALGNAI